MSPANVMAGVDFGRYKRIMQFIWDPPPKNDDPSLAPIWCLGKRYAADAQTDTPSLSVQSNTTGGAAQELDRENVIIAADHLDKVRLQSGDANGGVLTTNANEEEQGWPSEFLDDFESRFWFTYRSHFPPIRKSEDPSASSAMTLAVRLRSQLVDQGGFTSDTGWGCMIRSGQCLIANAMGLLDFGRGMATCVTNLIPD
jgi:cysteine protease ATG4